MPIPPMYRLPFLLIFGLVLVLGEACSPDEVMTGDDDGPDIPVDTTDADSGEIDFSLLGDTYYNISAVENAPRWGVHNVHDPSVFKDGDYYYSYNTDVAFGTEVRPGLQIRRSKNLVTWQFLGWVFEGLPQQGANFIRQHGGLPNQSLWAPYAMKVGDSYRLYYSLASNVGRLSAMGLATADDPRGPWTERGLVVTSTADNYRQTNAIDPSVVVAEDGSHWFYYGSAWDGIYVLELDPATGLPKTSGDKGVRVAQRGFTGGTVNGNIEGPEVMYHSELDAYYLFIAYDWLETKYNVRVGRSGSPTGPFLDYFGNDVNTESDNAPMILAPYRFAGHSGYQGVSHPAVFHDGTDWYMAHQARPGENKFFMNLHVRRIYWTEAGWPIVSPERYAGVVQDSIGVGELPGDWEIIDFDYSVVPGYAEQQTDPDFQESNRVTFSEDGTFGADSGNTWSYTAPWLVLTYADGRIHRLRVARGRDWENEVPNTLILTGLNAKGYAVWGKKR
ncbi:arabinan endo-1,5-alpha-L-arabinosidase [Neolewinella xylanilytica]|uniref:Arabinan endo-1,5-alpha-L-arabinosidase n=1 Tax=Neolewinella xylanilytica TaxID=1514080 RepID=A0A2S6I4P0_9BACT|nr:arabinan endo-1,5-alpha-L-arabinosidase [Neolewinella xylanilytica]PPK86153.1 arabinan endo-1,5-alpha-L-arabinosidase [Neolewinella xylanilytica]